MKSYILVAAAFSLAATSSAFQVAPLQQTLSPTDMKLQMVGSVAPGGLMGGDAAAQEAELAEAAKAMGMTPDEYQVVMTARTQFAHELDSAVVSAGDAKTILVTRDANNPPNLLQVEITEDGKALGKEAVANELVKSLKSVAGDAAKARGQAQQKMMSFLNEKIKR